MSAPLPLDRVTPLPIPPGGYAVVIGAVTTAVDGTVFDVATCETAMPRGTARSGGLFDLVAGGLRATRSSDGPHAYRLTGTGQPGVGCAEAGAASPCLVPRLAELSHERLKTAAEMAGTLSGAMRLEAVVAPAQPFVRPEVVRAVSAMAVFALVVAMAGACTLALRRRSRGPLGRVRRAAREALRAMRGDRTYDPVRGTVQAMLARAGDLEVARRACQARIARFDRSARARPRDAAVRLASGEAPEALAWVVAERAEMQRVRADYASSVLGLDRIESTLRVIALRARQGRGAHVRALHDDPVDNASAELALREHAWAEVDRAGDR